MREFKKLVAGTPYTDEKGSMTIPPKMTAEMSIKNNRDWVEISIQETVRNQETQR